MRRPRTPRLQSWECQNPPENPAKETDSRFKAYQELYGDASWELDALDPAVIGDLIRRAVLDLRDEDLWKAAVAEEERMRRELRQYARDYQRRQEG